MNWDLIVQGVSMNKVNRLLEFVTLFHWFEIDNPTSRIIEIQRAFINISVCILLCNRSQGIKRGKQRNIFQDTRTLHRRSLLRLTGLHYKIRRQRTHGISEVHSALGNIAKLHFIVRENPRNKENGQAEYFPGTRILPTRFVILHRLPETQQETRNIPYTASNNVFVNVAYSCR